MQAPLSWLFNNLRATVCTEMSPNRHIDVVGRGVGFTDARITTVNLTFVVRLRIFILARPRAT